MVISNWQFAISYKYSEYIDTNSHTTTLEYAYYFTDNLYFKQTVYFSLPTKSSALLTELHYKSPTHLEWFLNYTISNTNEELSNSNTILSTDGRSLNASIEYPITNNFSLGCKLSYDKNTNKNNSYWK